MKGWCPSADWWVTSRCSNQGSAVIEHLVEVCQHSRLLSFSPIWAICIPRRVSAARYRSPCSFCKSSMQISFCLLFACGLIRYRLAFFQHDAVLRFTVISETNSVLSNGRPTSSPIVSSQILAEDMSEFRFMVGSLGRTSTSSTDFEIWTENRSATSHQVTVSVMRPPELLVAHQQDLICVKTLIRGHEGSGLKTLVDCPTKLSA